ncbi:MAG: hypothetical protein PVH00_01625 [Gemmatimonadota bacterium]
MTARKMERTTDVVAQRLPRELGLAGKVAVSWAMAGGVGLGGVAVGIGTLTGKMSAHALLLTSTGLFIVGALLGFVHGAVLGFFGRTDGVTKHEATQRLMLAAVYAIPGLAVAWLVSNWMAMTVVARYAGRVLPMVGAGAGWVVGAAILVWAGSEGWRGLQSSFARWPEWKAGTTIVFATWAALLVSLLVDRPELLGLRLDLTPVGAVLLAAAIALWLVGPVVTAGLTALRRLPGRRPVLAFRSRSGLADIGIAIAAGAVVGLVALPFSATTILPTGGLGVVAAALGQALFSEVVFRLFLMTAVVWVLLRWHRVHREEAALIAVVAVVAIETLLYLPGVAAAGFPTAFSAAGYMLAAVALPAAVFAVIYWLRGLGTAVLAHVTAYVALAAIVL